MKHKLNVICSWGFKLDLETSEPVELYVDKLGLVANENKKSKKILLLFEPEEITGVVFRNNVIKNCKNFDYILTHNEDILNKCENAILFEFGSTWIKDYDFPKKRFEVSTVVGSKKMAEGHKLRHQLWSKQNEIKIPKNFFISGRGPIIVSQGKNPILRDDKNPLFESQFHIVIENTKRKNWFTEKLIDCFQTKTVPIYYGCPNISDWFDTRGMIMANNLLEIINACNYINENTYNEMQEYIEYNYKKSNEYSNLNERICDKILELCK